MIKQPLNTYGILEYSSNLANFSYYREQLERNGFCIVKDVFSSTEISEMASQLDLAQAEQEKETFGTISPKDADNIRCPLAYSEVLLSASHPEKIISILQEILGKHFVLLMQNGIINRPRRQQYQSNWHRDLNYQHWTSSKELALNFLICVNDFSVSNGCTWALPGSHLHSSFPSEQFVTSHEIPLEASAGSVLLLNSMTFHRAGVNTSSNDIRRAINHVVGRPFMSQQIDIPSFLREKNKDYSNSDFLNSYLGYKWNPASNPHTWRTNRSLINNKGDQL
jgi:ectoine hydroxylase-related dioxygenase (phytanoyl-CoA dioxygenase family)